MEAEAEEMDEEDEAAVVSSRPAAAAAADRSTGCGKCRRNQRGCGQCREWARTGRHGYYMDGDLVMAGPAA